MADPKTSSYFDFWIEQERLAALSAKTRAGSLFRIDRPSYAAMMEEVRRQGVLPFDDSEDEGTISCFCAD